MRTVHRLIVLVIFSLCTVFACRQNEKSDSGRDRGSLYPKDEKIARLYCSSCHLFPEPGMLDKDTWERRVLPDMGRRLGIVVNSYNPFEDLDYEEKLLLRTQNVYPDSLLISPEEWSSIVSYYTSEAPEVLNLQKIPVPVSKDIFPFEPKYIDIDKGEFPKVTLLYFDTVGQELYIGDHENLYALNKNGELGSVWELTSPAVDIQRIRDNRLGLLTIGSFIPSDKKEGVFLITKGWGQVDFFPVKNDLPRPVSFATADIDGDGKDDLVVCGFGHHRGDLSWYSNFGEKHVLSLLPGARMAIPEDMNGDGLTDLVVLMAQAWEGVDIYYNRGDGRFSKDRILEFSPLHGVSYMELVDFNHDGFLDLLVTNGDNWDFSMIPKPYHGIRIYLNDGHNNFEESFFYPMEGCNKAIARDFRNAGKLDIAAVSFYDNVNRPEQSFVYLKDNGELAFEAFYIKEAARGKWLTMEAGDFNGDGKLDLFLGSYFHNIVEWSRIAVNDDSEFPEVLLLLNRGD